MIVSNKDLNKISKYLWSKGHGGKTELAEAVNCQRAEISRMLRGGHISEKKLNRIKKIVG